MDRLALACQGKSKSQGGLNVSDMLQMAKQQGYTGKSTRADLMAFLCKPKAPAPVPVPVPAPLSSKSSSSSSSSSSSGRLALACQGKSKAQGGMNVGDMLKLAKSQGYTGKGTRADLVSFLCGCNPVKPKIVAIKPTKPKSKPKPVKPSSKSKAKLVIPGQGAVAPVPGSKSLSKDRKTLLNKYPRIKQAYIDILREYGMDLGFGILGAGSFSDVYDLGNGTVLRIEPSSYMDKYALAHQRINQYLIKNPHDVFPKIYKSRAIISLSTTDPNIQQSRSGWVVAAVMEKLDIDSWSNWRNHFSSPEALVREFKQVTRKMHDTGLIHTDISPGNVVLLKDGRIMFVDIDDSCFIPGCNDEPGRTSGYQAPEWALHGYGAIKGAEKKAMIASIEQWGIDPASLPTSKDFKKGHYEEHIKQNSIYSMGMLAYAVITGKDPVNGYKITEMRGDILPMIHPDPAQRSL